MREFDFLEPTSVDEASRLLAQHGDDARAWAGGTALMLAMRQRMLVPTHVVALAGIERMHGISYDAARGLRIGALSRHSDVARSADVGTHYPMLAGMAQRMANVQVRNQGTVGGNLCYGDPATDPPTCLMALGASVVLGSSRGERTLALEDFLVDYYVTALELDELVLEVLVPPAPAGFDGRYRRYLRTAAEHRPLVNVGITVQREGALCLSSRFVVGASVPVPCRVPAVEDFLASRSVTAEVAAEAAAIAAQAINPLDDQRGSADYRREMVRVVAHRTLADLFGLPHD